MNKLKLMILSLLGILSFGTVMVAQSETISNSSYEIISDLIVKDTVNSLVYQFDSVDFRDQFLEANSGIQTRSNATGVADSRRKFVSSVRKTLTSGAISSTVYGGKAGASISSDASFGFTDPTSGLGFNLGRSVTHNVPPYTYGHIIGKASYNLNTYRIELRYLGTNRYVSGGTAYSISNVNTWTELRTWK